MKPQNTIAVILAAGKGTRINAPENRNKVTFHLNQRPMISYSVKNLHQAGINDIVVVVGHASESIIQALGDSVSYATQAIPNGTGTALKAAIDFLSQTKPPQTIISVYGDDSAFYPVELFQTMLQHHLTTHAAVTLLTINKSDPTGCGRIIRDQAGKVQAIVEEKNATPEQKQITEINTGFYCFDFPAIQQLINLIQPNPVSGEYYLTDVVEIALERGLIVESVVYPDEKVWFGINTTSQLEAANLLMQQAKQGAS